MRGDNLLKKKKEGGVHAAIDLDGDYSSTEEKGRL